MSVRQWLRLCSQAQRYPPPWWEPWRHQRGTCSPSAAKGRAAWGEPRAPGGPAEAGKTETDGRAPLSSAHCPAAGGRVGIRESPRGVAAGGPHPALAGGSLSSHGNAGRRGASPGPDVLLPPVDSRAQAARGAARCSHLSRLPPASIPEARAGGPGPCRTGRTPGSQRLATCPGVTRGVGGPASRAPPITLLLRRGPPGCRVRPLPVTGSGAHGKSAGVGVEVHGVPGR